MVRAGQVRSGLGVSKLFLFSEELKVRAIRIRVGPSHNAWSPGHWQAIITNGGENCLSNKIEKIVFVRLG